MLLIADHKELLHRGTRSIPLPVGRTKANGIFRSELRPATDGLAGHYDTPVLATSSQLHACSARIGYTVRLQSHDNGRGNGGPCSGVVMAHKWVSRPLRSQIERDLTDDRAP